MTQSTPTDPPAYSPPRSVVTKYTVYPTGYDQSPFSDTHSSFCVYVEQFPDTLRWRVHDGFRHGEIASRTGRWIRDIPLNRRWTRFDTAEEALSIALIAVDTRKHRRLTDWIESPRGQEIVREQAAG